MGWLSLLWRRLTHRIDPALVAEAHIQAAAARAGERKYRVVVCREIPCKFTVGHTWSRDSQGEFCANCGMTRAQANPVYRIPIRTPDTGASHE